jgi:hypothetical protein
MYQSPREYTRDRNSGIENSCTYTHRQRGNSALPEHIELTCYHQKKQRSSAGPDSNASGQQQ